MRIGLFTDTYLPNVNGVAVSIATLKKKLEDNGHTVFVVCSNTNPFKMTIDDCGTVYRMPGIKMKKLYGYSIGRAFSIRGARAVKKMKLDVMHVHTEYLVGMFAKMQSRIRKIPLVYTYHTMYEDYSHYISKRKFVKNLIKKASKGLCNWADEVIAPSEKTRDVLRSYGVEKYINIIPTGLDLHRFFAAANDTEKVKMIREEYKLDGKTTLLFLGRMAPEKSLDLIVKGFAKLTREDYDDKLRLMLVGYGPSEKEIRLLVKELNLEDKVIFTGKVPPALVPYFYRATDLFVNASCSETQGLTYIEAMASGLPVVCRYDDNLTPVIDDGENGYFFKDEEGYVESVNKVLAMSSTEVKSLRANAIAKTKKYDDHIFAERIMTVYDRVVSTKK